MESGRVRGFRVQFSGAGSQTFPLALDAVLRRADEHFDQIVMQAVIELALEAPFKLGIVQVTRVKIEVIGVDRDGRILELDHQFYAVALRASGKIEQWMLVKSELREDAFDADLRTVVHKKIVFDNQSSWSILGSFPPEPILGS